MTGFDLNSLLNKKSQAVAVQEQGPAEQEGNFDVVMIDVEDLMPSKDNFYSTENIEELALTIELVGCIEQNLVVKPEAHGKYEVIAGHRRRLAALKLVSEGKEKYRKVPCRIKKESDEIKDRLALIITNSTARQLSDWEKVQQVKELKEVLTEYKDAIAEENRGKPKEERENMGRMREIVAQMLNVSTTQVGRMESIDKNLSEDFKEELKEGNINISTAHELSRLDAEGQEEAFKKYEEKGGLHIKDVKEEEQQEEITEEQIAQVQSVILSVIKGQVNRDIFGANGNQAEIEKILRKYFSKDFDGGKVEIDGKQNIYRFSAEGIIIINEKWENYLIEYGDLASIVNLMIDNEMLAYDDEAEERSEQVLEKEQQPIERTEQKETEGQQKKEEELPGQKDITDYPECLPEVKETGLPFTQWIRARYGQDQYTIVCKEVSKAIRGMELVVPQEVEEKVSLAISDWMVHKTMEYQEYLGEVFEPGYLGENVALGCRDAACRCGNVVRSYQKYCDECGVKLNWDNVHLT